MAIKHVLVIENGTVRHTLAQESLIEITNAEVAAHFLNGNDPDSYTVYTDHGDLILYNYFKELESLHKKEIITERKKQLGIKEGKRKRR